MAAEENECPTLHLSKQNSDPVKSWELDSVLVAHTLSFVSRMDERYLCPACGGIIFNPHQTGCGHIFCAKCIRKFIMNGDTSKCPLDGILIKSEEVFQDNCCKRELLNLDVFCTNSPDCSHKIPLCSLQNHLTVCQYELVKCVNLGCCDVLLRKDLTEHQQKRCLHRTELCRYCRNPYLITQLPDHEKNVCSEADIQCPNKCHQVLKRNKLNGHEDECPEVETDCMYKQYGCTIRDKRGQVKIHEYTEFSHHVLLVLESNKRLSNQVDQLQQNLVLQEGELKEKNLLVANLNREVTKCDNTLSALQRSMEEQRECVSSVKRELQDLRSVLEAELAKEELSALRTSLDSLREQVVMSQSLREHLGALGQTCQRHTRLLDIHVEQLQCNEQRFRQLESTAYDGKLIWKVHDYQRRKDLGAPLNSSPFYTGRSGYKLSARVYPDGEGAFRGTHLGLYVMLMRGDFDSLLPWPFRQTVTLTVLDQSGSRNHVNCSFTPDGVGETYRRPTADSNAALGYSCFISHTDLEAPRNAVFIKDDTLFIKVKVDTSGLEDL